MTLTLAGPPALRVPCRGAFARVCPRAAAARPSGQRRVQSALRRLLMLLCVQLAMDVTVVGSLELDAHRTGRPAVRADGTRLAAAASRTRVEETWCRHVLDHNPLLVKDGRRVRNLRLCRGRPAEGRVVRRRRPAQRAGHSGRDAVRRCRSSSGPRWPSSGARKAGPRTGETDPLTRCSTRRVSEPRLTTALATLNSGEALLAGVRGRRPLQEREKSGQADGDAVLAEVGRRMHVAAQPGDRVARPGGEEFLSAAKLVPDG